MFSQKSFFKALKYWMPQVVLLTFVSGLVYAEVQQNYRQSANDPQIQMAEDASAKLANGQAVLNSSDEKIDIAKSLAPFLITFDHNGNLTSSHAILNENPPIVPAGVFDYVKNHGQERFTWEPESGVRIAAVMLHFNGKAQGFVLAGRSLREVESRVDRLTRTVGLAYLAGLFVTLILSLALQANFFKRLT